jgi:hypothetical protein
MEPDGKGGWRPRRGRAHDGALTEAAAGERMLELVRSHHVDESRLEADTGERRRRGITFRELGQAGWTTSSTRKASSHQH